MVNFIREKTSLVLSAKFVILVHVRLAIKLLEDSEARPKLSHFLWK